MAATLQKRALGAGSRTAPARRGAVRVSCQKQENVLVTKLQLAGAALASVALLGAAPVDAKVILQQPELKKVFQEDDKPAAPARKKEYTRLPGNKTAPAPKAEAKAAPPKVLESSDTGFTPQKIALPASLLAIAGGAAALAALDEGFLSFMEETSVKNSGNIGAGYEVALKEGGVLGVRKASRPSTGTKAVKKAAATKSSSNPLDSITGIFGSKEE